MKRETNFWGRIITALWSPKRVFNRVENGTMDGMPDSYIGLSGCANWVELKAPDSEPVRPTTALFSGQHKLTQGQRNWLLLNRQAGCRGWVAIETPQRVLLIGAKHADDVNHLCVQALIDIAAFHAERPLDEEDWDAFRTALINDEVP